MARARSEQVNVADTRYYHCVCRCVRRAFLCGWDERQQRDCSHRKVWIMERLGLLAQVFSLELCAYAVMSNHYHLVVRLNPQQAEDWSDAEVIARWQRLFQLPLLVQRYQTQVELLDSAEQAAAQAIIAQWRQRLGSLSWYMRCLNEPLARLANAEDGCKGHFWESRFKSQAILDEAGLLACMVYVDLNPLRANVVATPEAAVEVSLHQRLVESDLATTPCAQQNSPQLLPPLLPFVGNPRQPMPDGLPYAWADYLQLVDWTGRIQREDKRGWIDAGQPAILSRLGLEIQTFIDAMGPHRLSHGSVVALPLRAHAYATAHHRRWVVGARLRAAA